MKERGEGIRKVKKDMRNSKQEEWGAGEVRKTGNTMGRTKWKRSERRDAENWYRWLVEEGMDKQINRREEKE
jgi:hypothetical protein